MVGSAAYKFIVRDALGWPGFEFVSIASIEQLIRACCPN